MKLLATLLPQLGNSNAGLTPEQIVQRQNDNKLIVANVAICLASKVGCSAIGYMVGDGINKVKEGDVLGGGLQMLGGTVGIGASLYGPVKAALQNSTAVAAKGGGIQFVDNASGKTVATMRNGELLSSSGEVIARQSASDPAIWLGVKAPAANSVKPALPVAKPQVGNSGNVVNAENGLTAIIADGAGAAINAPKTIVYAPTGSVVRQGNAPVCGPACAAMTISDNTGKSVSLQNVIGSFENGIRPTGVSTTELSTVISNAGIKNTVSTVMLPQDLNHALTQGKTVILNVNSHFFIVDRVEQVNGASYYMTRDPLAGPRGVNWIMQ
ncbi:MAG: hypothetical protein Q4G70_11435 [Pseudomonadota bacterium]|nr:hypothetical protein [Pseudomonadota bacterium]